MSTLSRRAVVRGGLAATAGASMFAPNASALLPGLLARTLMGFAGRTVVSSSARAAPGALSAVTRQRAADASRFMVGRGARPGDTVFGKFNREFAGGMGREVGTAAGKAVVRGLSEGWGILQGNRRPGPAVSEEHCVYACFPNDGYKEPAVLGCPEIALLEYLIDLAVRRFNTRGHAMTPPFATMMLYPLYGLEVPVYDDIWNTRTPTVYSSEMHVIRFAAGSMGTESPRVRLTVWMNEGAGPTSTVPLSRRVPEYEETVPFPHRFW